MRAKTEPKTSARKAEAARPLRLLHSNDTRRCIVPSYVQYPHQWLWDSCFHAMVLARLKPQMAARELDSLLASQWDDGRVPHISFGEHVPPGRYRPNADDWSTGRGTSGIIQPPLIATAAKAVFQSLGDLEMLRRLYPKIAAFHRWIRDTRDPHESGLVGVVHPWESGMDNSPIFDGIREAFLKGEPADAYPPRVDTRAIPAAQRPTEDDYRFDWGLVRRFQEMGWDGRRMAAESPVLVADVLFNSVWARANEDLSQIAWRLGRKEDSSEFRFWCFKTRKAIREKLWDPDDRFFYSMDLRARKLIPVRVSGGLAALYAQAATQPMAAHLVESLCDRRDFGGPVGVPSFSLNSRRFSPECYWRGPVWINIHWLLVQGLMRYGCFDLARELVDKSRRLVEDHGYWEYYDPFSGKGLGAPHFTWSALADVMSPEGPPAELRSDVQVLSRKTAEGSAELRTLYLRPEADDERIDEESVWTTPRYIATGILDDVRAKDLPPGAGAQGGLEARLRHAATGLKGLIESRRGAWREDQRVGDLGSLTAKRVLEELGLRAKIRKALVDHYFVVASDGEEEWIVDLYGRQFAENPLARIPLLIETMTTLMQEETDSEETSWMRLEERLLETQFMVERNLSRLGTSRLGRRGRHSIQGVLRRHQSALNRLLRLALPSSSQFLKGYQQWAAGVADRFRAGQPFGKIAP